MGRIAGGHTDLKRTIFQGIQEGELALLSPSGEEMEPTRPGGIGLTFSGIILD